MQANGYTNLEQGCHLLETPGNLRFSWKLLEKRFFFNFPWKSPGKSQGHQVLWFQWVLRSLCYFNEKEMVLPRIMSRIGSLITFKHCHSLVNLISVWNRFSDKIKHCLEWFFDKINDCLEWILW